MSRLRSLCLLGYEPTGDSGAHVQLYCPKCGIEAPAELTSRLIFAHPTSGVIRCGNSNCRAHWRIELHEIGEPKEAE